MGPYWVSTTEPVTVRAAWLAPPLPRAAGRDGVPAFGAWRSVADGACAGGAGAPEATVTAGWDLKDSSAASPATVPPRVRAARSIYNLPEFPSQRGNVRSE